MSDTPSFQVRRYLPDDKGRWDELIGQSKNGTFLFLRDYMDYHSDRFADGSLMVFSAGGERLVAVLPANHSGEALISHGGLTYGGLVTTAAMTSAAALDVFAAIIEYCKDENIAEITYKTVPAIYHKSPADEDKYALFYYNARLYRRELLSVVDLAAEVPVQERRSRGAKKARAGGMRIEKCEEFSQFWPILEENLGSRHSLRPVHTLAEIELLHRRFPDSISLYGAFDESGMCAGTVLYETGPTIHVQYTGSHERARLSGGLDLLYITLIEQFRGRARYFDFGNSNEQEGRFLNRGLSDFKEGFGARAVVHDFYRLSIRGAEE